MKNYFQKRKLQPNEADHLFKCSQLVGDRLQGDLQLLRTRPLVSLLSHVASWISAGHFWNLTVGYCLHSF